jgi:hypothetical protein
MIRAIALAGIASVLAMGLYAQSKPVFTEDFESGKIDPAVWDQRVLGMDTIAVDPADGAHGKFALHVHYLPRQPRGVMPSSSPLTCLSPSARISLDGPM